MKQSGRGVAVADSSPSHQEKKTWDEPSQKVNSLFTVQY